MLELNALSFAYPKQTSLFSHLSLTLQPGAICGLLGKNGSGKTTLLKIITGLIFPDEGECQVLGDKPGNRHPTFLQEVFFLPEDIYLPAISSKKYIDLYSGFYPRFDKHLLNARLKDFEINPNKILTDLSFGQKKKFLIAFALATNCRLLMMDEPTNGLDIPSKTQFRKAIASSISEEKLFIISTHQVHDVENLVDTIVMLDNGCIVFNQSIVKISEKLAFVSSQEKPAVTESFYFEKQLDGYKTIIPNQHQQDTEIDLELLFNGVLNNRIAIENVFAGEDHE